MKLWMCCVFMLLALLGYGQSPLDQRIDFVVENVSIGEALTQLSKTSNTDLAFSSKFFAEDQRVTLHASQQRVEEILDQLLAGTSIGYKVSGQSILLFRQKPAYFPFSGYVVDGSSEESLVSAAVYCPALQIGALTNSYGYFTLNLPPGTWNIQVRYIGYVVHEEELQVSGPQQKSIALTPDFTLEDVVISPEISEGLLPGLHPGQSVNLQKRFVQATPALMGEEDYIRAAQMLPGVQAGLDGLAGLHIRGGDLGHNLMLLDGVPLYIPFHLVGAYSVYNSGTIKSAKLVKGSFSAQYGGRLASIFDIRTREGNMTEWHGEAAVNLLNGRIHLEGPFQKNKGSVLVSGRYSPGAFLLHPVFQRTFFNESLAPLETPFYDLNAKVNYVLSPKDRVYVSFFTSYDEFEQESTSENHDESSEEELKLEWTNTTTALRWNHIFHPKLFANTTLTYSEYRYQYTTLEQFTPSDTTQPSTLYFLDNRSFNQDLGVKIDFDYSPSAAHAVKFGLGASTPRFNPVFTYLDQDSDELTNVDSVDRQSLENLIESEVQEVWEGHIYLEDQWKPSSQLALSLGMRGSFFLRDDHLFINPEPRVSLRYQPHSRISLFASGSRMIQYLHLVANKAIRLPNDFWLPAEKDLPPQDVWMAEAGMGVQFSEKFQGSVEVYYKWMNNLYTLPEGFQFLSTSDLGQPETYLFSGKGTAYGVEIQGEYSGTKTSALVSYTFSQTERQFDSLNLGRAFPQAYDRRHQFKTFMGYNLGKGWQLGANFVALSGNPQLILAATQSGIGLTDLATYTPGEKNKLRGPAYHRLDLNMSYTFDTGKFNHRFKVGAFNVYNQRNLSYFEETTPGQTGPVYGIPITPSVGYTVRY